MPDVGMGTGEASTPHATCNIQSACAADLARGSEHGRTSVRLPPKGHERWEGNAPLDSEVAFKHQRHRCCQSNRFLWRVFFQSPRDVLLCRPRCRGKYAVVCPRKAHASQPRAQRTRVQVGSASLCDGTQMRVSSLQATRERAMVGDALGARYLPLGTRKKQRQPAYLCVQSRGSAKYGRPSSIFGRSVHSIGPDSGHCWIGQSSAYGTRLFRQQRTAAQQLLGNLGTCRRGGRDAVRHALQTMKRNLPAACEHASSANSLRCTYRNSSARSPPSASVAGTRRISLAVRFAARLQHTHLLEHTTL